KRHSVTALAQPDASDLLIKLQSIKLNSRSGASRDRMVRAGGGQPAGEDKRLREAAVDSAILGGAGEANLADMSAEQYQRFEDNPFKVVRGEDALSTISTAVDTASYSNVRARINEGQMPAKDAVRIADFVNYFPYDYAAPQNADPVAFKLELAPCPWQPK